MGMSIFKEKLNYKRINKLYPLYTNDFNLDVKTLDKGKQFQLAKVSNDVYELDFINYAQYGECRITIKHIKLTVYMNNKDKKAVPLNKEYIITSPIQKKRIDDNSADWWMDYCLTYMEQTPMITPEQEEEINNLLEIQDKLGRNPFIIFVDHNQISSAQADSIINVLKHRNRTSEIEVEEEMFDICYETGEFVSI